nr:immunoglobulin heavy chain junction region [Macaca mulatta]MOY21488.1 immunoglobulin heavy chain junction region [Macaca mulatta]MOY22700.1 immunoglobulin heavy chain junction region [Macaca mulatta]MOY22857.1 immunoglobulin heavy chain junction region [Macaca mulatta]MOY23084.1 immunoglobulin heavy chain junction region [Macaca mulatta]
CARDVGLFPENHW